MRNRTEIWTAVFGSVWAITYLCLPSSGLAQIANVPGYQLSWHDEFNVGENLNANWNLTQQDNSNGERQYYQPQQDTLVNGNLRIVADKPNNPVQGMPYVSGQLISLATYTQGRFEARIDLPSGKGMWPAFWLNADDLPWPVGGEIDIIEAGGSRPTFTSSAFHWQKGSAPPGYLYHYNFTDTNFQAGFHTFAAEWDSSSVKYFVDGVQHLQVNYDPNTMSSVNFNTPMNIRFQLAVGGTYDGDPDATTTFPQYMDVDYVRVWKKQTGLLGDYNHNGVVDSGDYTVWRDTLGRSGIGLAADGSGNGTIDAADFTTWQAHYGATSAGSGGAVPEPTSFFLAAIAAQLILMRRVSRRSRESRVESRMLGRKVSRRGAETQRGEA
jgi:beta-glucanase (GH16 family)